MLVESDFIPVIAPIGVGDGRHAPTTSTPIWWRARSPRCMKAEKLMLLTNTAGLLDAEGELLIPGWMSAGSCADQ
jgi:acetylglutamate kinase